LTVTPSKLLFVIAMVDSLIFAVGKKQTRGWEEEEEEEEEEFIFHIITNNMQCNYYSGTVV